LQKKDGINDNKIVSWMVDWFMRLSRLQEVRC